MLDQLLYLDQKKTFSILHIHIFIIFFSVACFSFVENFSPRAIDLKDMSNYSNICFEKKEREKLENLKTLYNCRSSDVDIIIVRFFYRGLDHIYLRLVGRYTSLIIA